MTAKAWKDFYAAEREQLGPAHLERLIESAPAVRLGAGGTILFPHTRLSASGGLIAAAAREVVDSGYEQVVALGVLHGARREDAARVAAARAGDAAAIAELRGIHGPGAPGDRGLWHDEFSLDNFLELVRTASRVLEKPPPWVHARFPFLTGDDPRSLTGFDEVRRLKDAGAAVVATTDPVHHGIGYGVLPDEAMPRDDAGTQDWAMQQLVAQLSALSRRKYAAFLERCRACSSDFRDVGPVLAELLHPFDALKPHGGRMVLVDYSDVLNCAEPTWVAAAVLALNPPRAA